MFSLGRAYEHFLNLKSFGRGIEWTINEVPVRIDARCRRKISRFHDAELASYLKTQVKPGALCWDAGAHVGVYVMQLCEWAGPQGRVVAFEPNPATRVFLRKHVKLNKLDQRVTIVPAAVPAESGAATLYAQDSEAMSRLGEPNALLRHTKPITVDTLSLDGYARESGETPDFLLLDVEGFEFAALDGARRLLTENREICLIVEMHPSAWDSANMDFDRATALLKELRLRPVPLEGQDQPLKHHGHVQLLQYAWWLAFLFNFWDWFYRFAAFC